MNRSLWIGSIIALVVSSTAFVGADDATMPNCKDVKELADESFVGLGNYYVTESANVWEESNGFAGLQTQETSCRVKHTNDGSPIRCGGSQQPACDVLVIGADTKIA